MNHAKNPAYSPHETAPVIEKGYAEAHWDYYLLLEDDLREILEYIEPCNDNFQTYGPKLVKLLLAAGSEIDVAFKDLIRIKDPEALNMRGDRVNMSFFRKFAQTNLCQEFFGVETGIARSQFSCIPWDAWWKTSKGNTDPIPTESSLPWWTAYNNVKHHRTENYNQATLNNVLEAMAALFILIGSIARAESIHDGYRIPKILFYCDRAFGRVWTSRFEGGAIIMGDAPSFRFEPIKPIA